jgi:hypothetical protein
MAGDQEWDRTRLNFRNLLVNVYGKCGSLSYDFISYVIRLQ